MSKNILIIDDDRFLLENLRKVLEREGWLVKTAGSGEEGMECLAKSHYDLMILDLGLPGIDGVSACRQIRKQHNLPVIMLTARSDTMDKVIGLEVGADDYLTKPFNASELVARVRAHLRRTTEYAATDRAPAHQLEIGDLRIDYDRREVFAKGQACGLTAKEFDVVAYLAANMDRAVSRDTLFETVWGYELDFNSNSLDVYIYRIRKKIEAFVPKQKYLQTLRGFGYKLASTVSAGVA